MYYDKPDSDTSLADPTYDPHHTVPAEFVREELRLAAVDFVNRGKVKTQVITSPGTNLYQLTGSVQCGFGIVHRPVLILSHQNGELKVERHQCGCRVGAKGQFCGHCAALLMDHYGHTDVKILSAPSDFLPDESQSTGVRIRLGTQKRTIAPVFWTPENARQLAAPNIAIVGSEDTGNTQMVQSVALQLLRQKYQSSEPVGLLLFVGLDDCNDSHTAFVDATGAKVLRLHKLALNPFSLRGLERKPQLHTHRAMAFADALARAYSLDALQKSILVQSIVSAYAARGITADPLTWDLDAPTFDHVYEEYCARPQSQRSEDLTQVLENLSFLDLFDSEASEAATLYDMIQDTLILDMSGYPETLKHFALNVLLEMLCVQMQSRERTVGRVLQKMIFIDNADRLLSAGSPGLQGLLAQGREFGLGLLLSAQSLDVFQNTDFDYLKWIRAWVLHNLEDLRKADLEFLLQMDINDSALDRLYQESRHLHKFHSLIRISADEPVLAEDLAFYEIVGDTGQSYLIQETVDRDPEPLAGMPLLDAESPDVLVTLEEISDGPMCILDELIP